jgi:hypothetical protein
MKIQPPQQIADHVVRWREVGSSEMAHVDADVRSLKWRLWHGQIDRALDRIPAGDEAQMRGGNEQKAAYLSEVGGVGASDAPRRRAGVV